MKKLCKKHLSRLVSFLLVSMMLLGMLTPLFAEESTVLLPAEGIANNQTYVLKNKASGKYLSLPGFIEYSDTDSKTNVYQDVATINDQYSRAVKLTYVTGSGYTIIPLLYDYLTEAHVTVNDSGNVIVSSNVQYWQISRESSGEYKIISADGRALTAVGLLNGSTDGTSLFSSGNIIVSQYTGADSQLWEIESVGANPHMIKDTARIEKKNIGMGKEWLFQLYRTEMGSLTIDDYIVSLNEDLVNVKHVGNYLVVKMKQDDNDRSNDFALITIKLSNGQERTVVVQNAGTGHGDACITKPFTADPHLYTVTMNQRNTASEQANQHLLTFKSTLKNIDINSWSISPIIGESCLDFAKINEGTSETKSLIGKNFAVVEVKDVGVALVTAKNGSTEYKIAIEIQKNENGNITIAENIIDISASNGTTYDLDCEKRYVLKSDITVSSADDSGWLSSSESCGEISMYGDNFIILDTVQNSLSWLVMNREYFRDRIIARGAEGINSIYVQIKADNSCYINDGAYYIKNYNASKFIAPNDDSSVSAKDFCVQEWQLKYLSNAPGYYMIVSVKTGKALAVKENEETISDSKLVLVDSDSNSLYQQWRISVVLTEDDNNILNKDFPYHIVNRASQEAGVPYYRIYCDAAKGTVRNGSFYNVYKENDISLWNITSADSVFEKYSPNEDLVYTISYSDQYYLGISDGKLAVLPSNTSNNGKSVSVTWRFEEYNGYYKIFSMSAEAGNKLVAYTNSTMSLSDDSGTSDNELWLIRSYDKKMYLSPKSAPYKFFTINTNSTGDVSGFNLNLSGFSLNKFVYNQFYDGNLNIVDNEIYCVIDSAWDTSLLTFEELSNAITQWNGISSKINLVLCREISSVPLNAYYITLKLEDTYFNALGQTKCYSLEGNEYYFSDSNTSGINAQWSKCDVIIYNYVYDESLDTYINVKTIGKDVLQGTIIHEIGHTLKLKHADNGNVVSIMQPGDCDVNYITNFDKTALIGKWGI